MRSVRVALLLLIATPTAATGALQAEDLYSPGDGLVTFDDVTNLRWLDLSLTDGLSYNDILGGVGNAWQSLGWRHATTAEMCDLFVRYVATPSSCPQSGASPLPEGAADYLRLFMEPNSDPGDVTSLNGAFNDGSIGAGQGAIFLDPLNYFTVQAPLGISRDFHDDKIGNWLVQPIPEPSTALLVGCGLGVLAGTRRRRAAQPWGPTNFTFQRGGKPRPSCEQSSLGAARRTELRGNARRRGHQR